MKNLKFTLIVTLFIILSLVFSITSFATDVNSENTEVTNDTVSESTDESTTTETTEGESTEDDVNTEEPSTDNTEGTTDENVSEDEATEEGTDEGLTIDIVNNYFESNTDINFTKNVDGNVFLIGNNITINGKINGDLLVIGKNVTLAQEGQVYGNVFLIADNFTHIGLLYNLFAVTTNYTCEYDGLAALDLKVFAQNIKFSGYTERSTYFYADTIELTDDAFIMGNLVYNEDANLTVGENSTIYGQQVTDNLFSMITNINSSNLVISHIITIATLLGTVLFVLLMIAFFKRNTFENNIKFKFTTILKTLGIGILSFILLTVITAILLVSTIFTNAGFIVLMLFISVSILALPIVIITLATILYNKFNKGKSILFVLLYTILLTLIYYALSIIPYVGIIINIIISLTGFGLITLWLFNIRKRSKVNKNIEDNTSKKSLLNDSTANNKKSIDKNNNDKENKKDDKKDDK